MYEDFLNALQNFKQNKIRTILSLLGVIIGVASVIIITTIGESATSNIKSSFGTSGLDLINVSVGGMRWRARSASITLNDSFREKVFDNVENIKHIYYKNSINATLRRESIELSAAISAIEYGYLEMSGMEIDYGSFFSIPIYETGVQKIILGSEIAESLFPSGNPLGQTVTVDYAGDRFGFEVVGILKEQQTAGMESPNRSAYIPRAFYSKKIIPNAAAATMIIHATNQDYAVKIAEDVEAFIEKEAGATDVAQVMSMASMLSQFDEITGTVSMLLSGIAAISLLVGGIGIMNIMIVSVTERKKEIGIRKALGATPAAIRSQFLVESATITLLGGILGIIFGLLLSFVIDFILSWTFAIQWGAIALAFVFSAFVGIFFGLSPAARAAKLDPVEALASE